MSSFIGHFVTGGALYLAGKTLNSWRSLAFLGLVSFLAMSPDVDYFLFWIFKINLEPRITHSIGFCLGVSGFAWLMANLYGKQNGVPSLGIIIAAPISHLVLDFLVGIHPMPLFWPMSYGMHRFSYGVLPSAGIINIFNYFFWRNLIVELSILIPLLAAIVLWGRNNIRLIFRPIAIWGWLIFLASLSYAITLHRP